MVKRKGLTGLLRRCSGQQPYTPANMGLEEHSDVPLAKSFMTDMVQAVKDAKQYLEMA
ncbi:TPA: hypothetical protein ACH3X1_006289 [Trebouxia sp. C0004]